MHAINTTLHNPTGQHVTFTNSHAASHAATLTQHGHAAGGQCIHQRLVLGGVNERDEGATRLQERHLARHVCEAVRREGRGGGGGVDWLPVCYIASAPCEVARVASVHAPGSCRWHATAGCSPQSPPTRLPDLEHHSLRASGAIIFANGMPTCQLFTPHSTPTWLPNLEHYILAECLGCGAQAGARCHVVAILLERGGWGGVGTAQGLMGACGGRPQHPCPARGSMEDSRNRHMPPSPGLRSPTIHAPQTRRQRPPRAPPPPP